MEKKVDYNRLDDGTSFNGWRLTDLLIKLTDDASAEFGRCECRDRTTCHHAGAANLRSIIRFVQHPEDCEDCRRIEDDRQDRSR